MRLPPLLPQPVLMVLALLAAESRGRPAHDDAPDESVPLIRRMPAWAGPALLGLALGGLTAAITLRADEVVRKYDPDHPELLVPPGSEPSP